MGGRAKLAEFRAIDARFGAQLSAKAFEMSKSKCTMAASNVADRAANFIKNFWPAAFFSGEEFSGC
jgi:hypothetical protein